MINRRRFMFVFGFSAHALLFLGTGAGWGGDLAFTVSANNMREEPTGDIVYEGDVQLKYVKLKLVADKVRMTKPDDSFGFGTISATGHVHYVDGQSTILADQIVIRQVHLRLPGWQRISAQGGPVRLTHVPASTADAIRAEATALTWKLDEMTIVLSGNANFRFRAIDVTAERIEYDEHLGLVNGIRLE